MPLIIAKPNRGRRDIMIILGPENVERMQQKDPFELIVPLLPFDEPIGTIRISIATEDELKEFEQLGKQGKTDEAIDKATAGWKFRPELGDHDRGPEILFRQDKNNQQQ